MTLYLGPGFSSLSSSKSLSHTTCDISNVSFSCCWATSSSTGSALSSRILSLSSRAVICSDTSWEELGEVSSAREARISAKDLSCESAGIQNKNTKYNNSILVGIIHINNLEHKSHLYWMTKFFVVKYQCHISSF